MDLLKQAGALDVSEMLAPAAASRELLTLIHRPDYVDIVQALSAPSPALQLIEESDRYGLHTEDTPYFAGMHEAASLIVGGTVLAAELVMSGQAEHAYHMAGGLHHAFPDRGSGFCVYNDAAVAIADIKRRYQARILYIDTDVHHGDGVQWAFYSDPDVMTYSIHETGKFLFPGSGFIHERGNAEGFGTAVNVPVEPYTEDDSWLECFRETVHRAAAAFRPDLIISQHGCDAHAFDPLSHIHCSMRTYAEMPGIIHELAHTYTDGRWVAVGGGGYDIWRVVPRAWALVWLEMLDHPIMSGLRSGEASQGLPEGWQRLWQPESPVQLPNLWLDDTAAWTPMPRRTEIERINRATMELAAQFL
jgi:acetoin utilization protein AcuC